MKKPTISIEELRAVVATFGERMALPQRMNAWLLENDATSPLNDDFAAATEFLATAALPAASDGRGERFSCHVFILWHDGLGPVDVAMAELTDLLLAVPGVEAVSAPSVDTQLHALWGVVATFRTTQ